jgi:amino acid permease
MTIVADRGSSPSRLQEFPFPGKKTFNPRNGDLIGAQDHRALIGKMQSDGIFNGVSGGLANSLAGNRIRSFRSPSLKLTITMKKAINWNVISIMGVISAFASANPSAD